MGKGQLATTGERNIAMEASTATPTTRTTTTRSAFPLKFVLIAFAFTWVFWGLTVLEGRGLISSLPVPALFLGAFGPMVAAVVLTAHEGGRAGLRSLLSRVVRWRVAPLWYGVVLLGPIVLQLLAMALNVLLGGPPPDPLAMIGVLPTVLALSVYMLIQVGIGEEIGWRGYALPKLQAGYSALISSLIVGVLWALWHLPLFFNPATGYYITPFWVFLVFLLPFAILYTWVFNSTGGSVLMVMILHAVVNASSTPLWRSIPEYSTMESTTTAFITYNYLLQAAVLWVGAIVVVLIYGATNLSRRSKQLLANAGGESHPRVQ
jgi:membrane protease YdiL (CAAX protease family)